MTDHPSGTPQTVQVIVGTGHRVHVNPDDHAALTKQAYEALRDAEHQGRHLWVATLAFRVADPAAGHMVFDLGSLFTGPAIGCFVCERPYEPGMAGAPCGGNPS